MPSLSRGYGTNSTQLRDDLLEHATGPGVRREETRHGTIVMVHDPDSGRGDYSGPEGYTAEFTYLTGETWTVVDLRPDQVRPAEEGELARATKVV